MANKTTETTAADAKPELAELLREWDESPVGKRAATAESEDKREGLPADALREDADTDAFGDRLKPYLERLTALEGERGRLSGDLTSARMYENRHREIVDKFDYERLCDRIADETSLDRASIEARVKLKLAEDGDFLTAAESRYSSDDFNGLADEFVEELSEQHPKIARGSLRAAVLAARFSSAASSVSEDYGNFAKMSDAEFLEVKQKVFADARSGRLKSSRGRGGGFFSTTP
jgi:hypothetical protein